MQKRPRSSVAWIMLLLPVVFVAPLWEKTFVTRTDAATADASSTKEAEDEEKACATVECILGDTQDELNHPLLEIVKAPVAHYAFDGDTTDSSANCLGLDGIPHGMPTYEASSNGLAIRLDGIDDYVECDDPQTPLCIDAITVTCRIMPDELDGQHGLIGRAGSYAFKISDGHLRFTIPEMVDYDGGQSILKAGVWQHVAVSFMPKAREGLAFYVDGVQTDLLNADDRRVGTGPTLIGASQWPNELFQGQMDDVRIYDRVLSREEIAEQCIPDGHGSAPESYVVNLVKEAEDIVRSCEPQEAVAALEQKIVAHERWRAMNLAQMERYDLWLPSDFQALLAYAKARSGVPIKEVIATYKQAASQPHEPSRCIPDVLLWLFERMPTGEYLDLVGKCVCNSDYPNYCVYRIARRFEAKNNWNAFQCFLDATFLAANDVTSTAKAVAKGLAEGGVWAGRFLEYCQDRPELAPFLFGKEEAAIRGYLKEENHAKASQVCRDILSRCSPSQKSVYEFKLCECLFKGAQYESALDALDTFISRHATNHRVLTGQAIMLKGQAYVYLGDMDRASDTFLKVIIEYPEAKQAPAAIFFSGYCHMLRSRFKEAKESFRLLTQIHPASEYATQASSYLDRIESMTQERR